MELSNEAVIALEHWAKKYHDVFGEAMREAQRRSVDAKRKREQAFHEAVRKIPGGPPQPTDAELRKMGFTRKQYDQAFIDVLGADLYEELRARTPTGIPAKRKKKRSSKEIG